jgi:hypothetical protein
MEIEDIISAVGLFMVACGLGMFVVLVTPPLPWPFLVWSSLWRSGDE